jgi:hypothetical protein
MNGTRSSAVTAAVVAVALAAGSASAAAAVAEPFALGPKSLSYGVGLRVGGGYTDSPAASGLGIGTLNVRPYISGQVAPWLKFAGNLDLNYGDAGRIHVLDAVAQFEPNDLFNVWMGRFLPPTDRANLSGPYYQNAWNYPTTVNGYPSIYAGRADGAAVWGQINKGVFKYQLGVFTVSPTVLLGQAIYAARLVYNFLDPEPGYYNSSTYYGSKDVLAIGGALQYKKTPDPVTGDKKLLGFNLDLLFEKKIVADVLSLEGAYYNFDQGNTAGQQGWSYYALASWLFGAKLGPGRFQPMARFQYATAPGGGPSTKTFDGGFNYILDGHNARAALVVQNTSPPVGSSMTNVQLGIQIQE